MRLESLSCTEEEYRGELIDETGSISGKCQLIFRNENKELEEQVDLVKEKNSLRFRINYMLNEWENGNWKAYVRDENGHEESILIDYTQFPVEGTIFSMDLMRVLSKKRMFLPCAIEDTFHLKVAKTKNAHMRYKTIPMEEFQWSDGQLKFNGFDFEEVEIKESRLLITNGGEQLRYTKWFEGNGVTIDYSVLQEFFRENIQCSVFRIYIEANNGNTIYRFRLELEDTNELGRNRFISELDHEYDDEINEDGELISEEPDYFTIFLSQYGVLTFAYEKKDLFLTRYILPVLSQFKMKKNRVQITAKYRELLGWDIEKLLVVNRKNEEVYKEFEIKKLKLKEGYQSFQATILLNEIEYCPFFYDVYVVLHNGEDRVQAKIKSFSLKEKIMRRMVRHTYYDEEGFMMYPYVTKGDYLAFLYRERTEYDTPKYQMKETIAVWIYKATHRFFERRNIWLFCEKYCETAQDNGYYFFRYCLEQDKNREMYFIIKKESPDYQRFADKKNVIPFMSWKHLIYMQAPVLLVSSESRVNFYIKRHIRGRVVRRLNYKPYVFLQHGVIALKKIENGFRKSDLKANLFVTSSAFEKSLIVDNFGFEENEVIATGLPRWDAIVDQSKTVEKREIIIMPTWRVWLEGLKTEDFLQSQYYQVYSGLLSDQGFVDYIAKNDIIVNFIIHPLLKQYVEQFGSMHENIKIFQFGEVPINQLLMRGSLLVTDYSSVAWDMCYSNKPVVFFRFDIEQYEETQGAYIDLHQADVGEIVQNTESLLNVLTTYHENGYVVSDEYYQNRQHYVNYYDKCNSKRIYDEIMNMLEDK